MLTARVSSPPATTWITVGAIRTEAVQRVVLLPFFVYRNDDALKSFRYRFTAM